MASRFGSNVCFHPKYETVEELHPIPDNIAAGDVVTISCYEPLIEDWRTIPLYIRPHLVDCKQKLDSFLNNTRKQELRAVGAPGCGSTCFFWLWASMLMKQGKRVLYIQVRECLVWVMDNGIRSQMTTMVPTTASNLHQFVGDVLDSHANTFDVCICDGVIATKQNPCDVMCKLYGQTRQEISKLIFVTSLYFCLSHSDGFEHLIDKSVKFDSWQLEDYEMAAVSTFVQQDPIKAVLMKDLGKLIRKNGLERDHDDSIMIAHELVLLEIVRLKFHFAGGSARYMFDLDIERLTLIMDEIFQAMVDYELLTITILEGKENEAVNLLMQKFSGWCTPVSKHILMRAHHLCGRTLTDAVGDVARHSQNQMLQKWLSELSQLDSLSNKPQGSRRYY